MISLDKIPDALGHLVLTDDGAILSSGGELENNEHVATVVSALITLTDKLGPDNTAFKKVSVTFKDCSYVICLSNKKIYIVKKRFQSPAIEEVLEGQSEVNPSTNSEEEEDTDETEPME